HPQSAEATVGGPLAIGEDGRVNVATADPDKNTYIVTATMPAGRVDGVALTVFNGESGPGRTPHGNFVLSEVSASRIDGDTRSALPFGRAEADFSQENYSIADAIDGKPNTGWGIAG